jgi:hypothetical protein
MSLVPFLRGAVALGCLLIALFFLRFWRTTTDRLFLWFSIAFVILSVDYVVLGLLPLATEWRVPVYGVRLVAFGVMLYAIVSKNRE